MTNEEVNSRFKQYTEGVRVSSTKNSNWELNNSQLEWDKQQTNNSTWEKKNTLKEWDNVERSSLFEI